MIGYGECTKCNKWGYVPKTFNEGKYFLKCPICKGPMYLIRGEIESWNKPENKVEITEFIKHNG